MRSETLRKWIKKRKILSVLLVVKSIMPKSVGAIKVY